MLSLISQMTDGKTIELSKDELKAMETLKAKEKKDEDVRTEGIISIKEEDDGSDSEVLKDLNLKDLSLPGDLLDNDLVNTLMAEEEEEEMKPNVAEQTPLAAVSVAPKDELTDILSPHFNLEGGLPDMDSRDVEEIFKDVMTEDTQPRIRKFWILDFGYSQMAFVNFCFFSLAQNMEMTVQTALPSPAVMQPNFAHSLPSPYHSEYSNSPHSQVSEPPSPWLDEPPLSVEPTTPSSHRSTPQKMEADEALGLQATISSVLYANTNHGEWKTQFPGMLINSFL